MAALRADPALTPAPSIRLPNPVEGRGPGTVGPRQLAGPHERHRRGPAADDDHLVVAGHEGKEATTLATTLLAVFGFAVPLVVPLGSADQVRSTVQRRFSRGRRCAAPTAWGLQEVNHRVQNSLHLVNSMLSIQERAGGPA